MDIAIRINNEKELNSLFKFLIKKDFKWGNGDELIDDRMLNIIKKQLPHLAIFLYYAKEKYVLQSELSDNIQEKYKPINLLEFFIKHGNR